MRPADDVRDLDAVAMHVVTNLVLQQVHDDL
jgi:hypothetical protein